MSLVLGPRFPPDHRFFGPWLARTRVRGTVIAAAAAPTDIWPFPGSFADFTATGVATAVSTSVEDNPLGTGVGSIDVLGCTHPDNEVLGPETIVLDGTTPVAGLVTYKNPLLLVDAILAGSGGDEFDTAAAAGDITVTVGGVDSDKIFASGTPGSIGNRSFGAGLHISKGPGGIDSTIYVTSVIISIGVETTGKGQVEVTIFRKRGSTLPVRVANPLTFETEFTDEMIVPLDIVLLEGDIFFARVTRVTKAVRVSVDFVATTYGPLP